MKCSLWFFMFEVKSETSYLPSQIRIPVLCDVTLCCGVSGSWHFKGTHYLHLQGQWSLYAADPWRWKWHIPSKSTEPTQRHSVTSQKTRIPDYIAV